MRISQRIRGSIWRPFASSGDALLSVINNILDLSKIESSMTELGMPALLSSQLLERVHKPGSSLGRQQRVFKVTSIFE